MLYKNELPIAAFPNKRQGGLPPEVKLPGWWAEGRLGTKSAGLRERAGCLPHRTDGASVGLSFARRISTLVPHWRILSSYKTLCYLHLLLIRKGKETPRAPTTGKRKRKERKEKEKGKKGKKRESSFELFSSNGQRSCRGKGTKDKNCGIAEMPHHRSEWFYSF